MSLGEKIVKLRRENNYTQEQLAEILNVSRQSVSKWESDLAYPETDKLLIIAKELGVSLDYLMDNTPSEDSIEGNTEIITESENKLMIRMFDGSQAVNCLSVKYSKISFPAKNEPAYILQAVDRVGFFGAHTVVLGWYEDEISVKKELDAIIEAMNRGDKVYHLQFFTNVKFSVLGFASRK